MTHHCLQPVVRISLRKEDDVHKKKKIIQATGVQVTKKFVFSDVISFSITKYIFGSLFYNYLTMKALKMLKWSKRCIFIS
jgi:hypothetical protein